MLLILRSIFIINYLLLVCIFGSIWCLFSPRNPRHVSTFSSIFGYLSKIFGIKVELRKPVNILNNNHAIYIANHQNNYDIIAMANIIQSNTVTIGKKSLFWIPFFGPLYWLSGNILIERNNHREAYNTINELLKQFTRKRISLWIFPEGTRSRGRGLLPFKTGAFHVALAAGVPIIPVVVSNTHNKIKLNRWDNGLVIVEMLNPVDTSQFQSTSVRKLADHCRKLMLIKLEELNNEVYKREQKYLTN